MAEQGKELENVSNSSWFWLILALVFSDNILQRVLENWLSKPMSESVALLAVYGPVPLYFIIRRKRSLFKKVPYQIVAGIWILICLVGAIALYYSRETHYPLWVTFVIFGICILMLIWRFIRKA